METQRTVGVYNSYGENYFSIVGLVLDVGSGRDRRGQIVRKPKFLACVVIR